MQTLDCPSQNSNLSLVLFPTPRPHNSKTRQLFGQLVRLLHSQSDVANRLVDYQRLRNPYKSEEWILEKVVLDLERDRNWS